MTSELGTLNAHFFDDIATEAQAYWLGFLLADGCVLVNPEHGNYALQVALQERDIDHLLQLAHDLGVCEVPKIDPRNGSARYVWYSKVLVRRLMQLHVMPRKSGQELPVPPVPSTLVRHFWRGIFDGDGCLVTQVKGHKSATPEYRFSLAGSRNLLEAFQTWARSSVGIRAQKIAKARNSGGESKAHVFYVNGNRQIAALTSALYLESERRLQRKYVTHVALLEQNARVRPSYRREYQCVQSE